MNKDKQLKIRVTEAQEANIKVNAAAYGMNITEYIIARCLPGEKLAKEFSENLSRTRKEKLPEGAIRKGNRIYVPNPRIKPKN